MNTKKVCNRSTIAQKIAIYNLMKEVLTAQKDGLWQYAVGWDDEKVAQTVSPLLRARHAKNIRLAEFGLLQCSTSKPKTDAKTIEARLDKLERAVAKLIFDLGAEISI